MPYWAIPQLPVDKHKTSLSLTFAEVATHNHFVLDRGGKVFKQTAPIIKLPANETEEDHLALLAYLNSSTACFWLKQVCFPKGMHNGSAANATPFLVRFAHDGSKLSKLPLPPAFQGRMRSRYVELGRRADALARERLAKSLVGIVDGVRSPGDLQRQFEKILAERTALLAALVAVQEEIDWLVYVDFGLADERLLAEVAPASLQLGARPFEVAGHRAGLADVREWFQWNETSVAEPPADAAGLIEQRIRATAASDELVLLERGEFKRRWVQPLGKAAQFLETDARVLARQLISWLAGRIESHVRACASVVTRRELKRLFESDAPLMATHQWLVTNGHLTESLEELTAKDAVPAIAAHRYSDAGMVVFQEWQEVWAFQRAEDSGKEKKPGAVPRKYEPSDFSEGYYSLRGPLDVPKERFISYPGCESDQDGEPVYCWAGWNHLQRAQVLAALYQKRKTEEGWTADRLTPMLAGLLELLPWIQQWHNERDPEYGLRMGDYFAQFLGGELATLGLTKAQLEAWRPQRATARRAKATSRPAASADTSATTHEPRRARKPRASADPTEAAVAKPARRKRRKAGDDSEHGGGDDASR